MAPAVYGNLVVASSVEGQVSAIISGASQVFLQLHSKL